MGGLWSGQSCRNETLELASVALWRRIGIDTIPNETTPFHIDRGMATQFTSLSLGWLLLVAFGHAPTSRRSITSIDAPNPTTMIASIVSSPVRSTPLETGVPYSLNAEKFWIHSGHLKRGPTSLIK